jgi:hypothetical protein
MQILPPLLCVGDGEVGADEGVDDGGADEGAEEGWMVDCVAVGEVCAPAGDAEDVVGCNAWRGV